LRRALFLLLALTALPVLAVAGVLAWANTEGGLAALAALASAQVPGSIEGLRGPLPSGRARRASPWPRRTASG
jgi:hypothetical protein